MRVSSAVASVRTGAGRVRLTIQILPTALRVRRVLRSVTDLRDLVDAVEAAAHTRRPLWRWCGPKGTDAAAGRAVRWLGVKADDCVPRSLTVFSVLTCQHTQASFESGVAKVGGQLRGHAWVQCESHILGGSRTALGSDYRVIFRADNLVDHD